MVRRADLPGRGDRRERLGAGRGRRRHRCRRPLGQRRDRVGRGGGFGRAGSGFLASGFLELVEPAPPVALSGAITFGWSTADERRGSVFGWAVSGRHWRQSPARRPLSHPRRPRQSALAFLVSGETKATTSRRRSPARPRADAPPTHNAKRWRAGLGLQIDRYRLRGNAIERRRAAGGWWIGHVALRDWGLPPLRRGY